MTIPDIRYAIRSPTYKELKAIAIYGLWIFVGFSMSLLAGQLDKLLINFHLGASSVGRYQAYYVVTFGILSSFFVVFNNYLLPEYGKHQKQIARKVLSRFLLSTALPLWIISLVCGRLIFPFFGKSYSFSWTELCWAATFTVFFFALQTLGFFAMTLGLSALAYNALAYLFFILIQLSVMTWLIQYNGVAGAFQGMSFASIVALAITVFAIFRDFRKKGECCSGKRVV